MGRFSEGKFLSWLFKVVTSVTCRSLEVMKLWFPVNAWLHNICLLCVFTKVPQIICHSSPFPSFCTTRYFDNFLLHRKSPLRSCSTKAQCGFTHLKCNDMSIMIHDKSLNLAGESFFSFLQTQDILLPKTLFTHDWVLCSRNTPGMELAS